MEDENRSPAAISRCAFVLAAPARRRRIFASDRRVFEDLSYGPLWVLGKWVFFDKEGLR